MKITRDNFKEAQKAIKDILFMYVDLIESYRGFGHNIEIGQLGKMEFIDVEVDESNNYPFGIDVSLLQSGSAVALLCELSNAWDEHGTWNVKTWSHIMQIKRAYESGRFDVLPKELIKAFSLGFGNDETAFRNQLGTVFRIHVYGYFEKITREC